MSRTISLQPAVRFRLLANLPLTVAFKSITYRLAIVQVPVSGMWQLRASWSGGYWLCAYRNSEDALRKAVYEEGLKFAGASVSRVIFERLLKERRAEVVAGMPSFSAGNSGSESSKSCALKIAAS